jgi:Tol biopolymer transport system component/DNA-binding winged helix-turn-helix (wHTH) protein
MVHSPSSPGGIVRFGVFELNPRSGELRKAGVRIALPDQPLAVLTALLERPGELVTREELRQRLWPGDTFVDFEHGVNAAVKRLRDALGDSTETPRFVETLPRRGYRFIAPVQPPSQPEHLDVGTSASPRPPLKGSTAEAGRGRWAMWAAAATVIVVAIVVAVSTRRPPPGDAVVRQPEMSRLTDDAGLTMQPTLSADGTLMAYASDRSAQGNLDIWIQRMDGSEPIRLTEHPADDDQPSLSPDGSQIAFRSNREGGGIYIMPAHTGGEPRLLARQGLRPRFSPDGRWISYNVGIDTAIRWGDSLQSRVYRTVSTGGPSVQVLPDFTSAFDGLWSPDGAYLLTCGIRAPGEPGDWWVVPVEGGTAVKTGLVDAFRQNQLPYAAVEGWLDGDRVLLTTRDGDVANIWSWPITPGTWQAGSRGHQLTAGASTFLHPASAGGRLVFSGLSLGIDIWGVPLQSGERRAAGPAERVTHSATLDLLPSISADGRILSFWRESPSGMEVWISHLDTGFERKLVEAQHVRWPVISRDGARVAYVRYSPSPVIESIAAAGGQAERICNRCNLAVPRDWSSDGRWLLYMDIAEGRRFIAALDLKSGESVAVLRHESRHLHQGHFSSDGRWVVFVEAVSPERRRIWVAPFRGSLVPQQEWTALSNGDWQDDKPRWSPDGSFIYFASNRDGFSCLWGQRLEPASKQPLDAPFAIHHSHSARLSMQNVYVSVQEISVARDRLVFNMGELTGNIWSLPLDSGPDR